MRTYQKILTIIIILTGFLNFLFAQDETAILDSKGTDFRLAFLPNYHNNYQDTYSNLLERTDSLYIFIVADIPTTGIIKYFDRSGNNYTDTFSIINTNKMFTFKVSHFDFELSGYNRSSEILAPEDPRNQSGKIVSNSFHIKTDNEVTIYAHSQAVMTSDAFLVLPTDVVGREYLIMAYNSDGEVNNGNELFGSSTPSQFAVIATEDNTKIHISATNEIYNKDSLTFEINLNAGEVFLSQAKITASNMKSDLTGTLVESDKPIVIFSGQQRTKVPVSNINLESRDFICEQMLPINTWGNNALVIPLTTPPDATPTGDDIYRVLAGGDGIDIFINGNYEIRLNKGEFFEKPIFGSATIEATGPILVAQFKKTSRDTPSGSSALSDPFMMIVPSKEQFMSSYSVMNTQAYQVYIDYFNNNSLINYKVYDLHYISITTPKDGIYYVWIDSMLIDPIKFEPVLPDSEYYFANIEVKEGSHRINSSEKIGVNVYGYGIANSYGYTGGFQFNNVDVKDNDIVINTGNYLEQNEPNPVNTTTEIMFGITNNSRVSLIIYDLLGNEKMVVIDKNLDKGEHHFYVNLSELTNGIYVYVLSSTSFVLTEKLIKLPK